MSDYVIENLAKGGLVIFPSDTVYGALVDATNMKAVDKLIEFKSRPPGKPISVFVTDAAMMRDYVSVGSDKQELLDHLLPGPFTLILESKHRVAAQLESENGTLGIRIPRYPLINDLVKRYGKPVTATSANLSGRPPHYSLDVLFDEFPESKKALIDLCVDGGTLPRNRPSTVVDLTLGQLKVLRQGDAGLREGESFVSHSADETGKIARLILGKRMGRSDNKPLVFILSGDMGAGKTVFVKAAGEMLGVNNIISPTYVVYYEYNMWGNSMKKFIHCDLFNIQEAEEFKNLGLDGYFREGNVIFIEWGEKAGQLREILKRKTDVTYIDIKYMAEKEREITVHD